MPNKNIGVALSGSGFLFPAHVGALQGLHDSYYDIKEIAGTSGGGLVAILYASGMSLTAMKNLVLSEDWSKFLKPDYLMFWKGFCNAKPMFDWLIQHTNGMTFKDTNIPLTVASSNITDGSAFYFNKEQTPDVQLALAGRATSSLPFVYPHVTYDNKILMDGGVVNNIPVDQLSNDLDRIGIELSGSHTSLSDNPTLFQISKQLVDLLLKSNEAARITWAQQTKSKILTVDTSNFGFLDDKMSVADREKLWEIGYNSTLGK